MNILRNRLFRWLTNTFFEKFNRLINMKFGTKFVIIYLKTNSSILLPLEYARSTQCCPNEWHLSFILGVIDLNNIFQFFDYIPNCGRIKYVFIDSVMLYTGYACGPIKQCVSSRNERIWTHKNTVFIQFLLVSHFLLMNEFSFFSAYLK